MTEWLTPKEAAEVYGVSERHIRNLCARGEIECMRLGKLWRVKHEREVAPTGATAGASTSRKEIL